METDLSFFFDWHNFNDITLASRMLYEFAENDAKNIVLTDKLLTRFTEEPLFRYYFNANAKKAGLKFAGCHGLWGYQYDLNCDDRQYRPQAIEKHRIAMGCAADSGCKSYVMHIGAICTYYNPFDIQKMRDLACDTLEKLIPIAEKENIVIAIENSFEPTNSADEVLYFINKFPSPFVGACYDSGHANIMKSTAKEQSLYESYLKLCWQDNVIFDDNTLEKMAPHIVTCHLHDNNGYGDYHQLPGDGTVDWQKTVTTLAKCPRIQNMQIEVKVTPEISIRKIVKTANDLKKYL